MARIAGICYIKVDGVQLDVSGGIEAPLSLTKKEPVLSAGRVVGYKETPIAPFVKLKANFTTDFPINQIRNGTNMTVTAEFANSKVFTLNNAFLASEGSTNSEDGTVDLEFNGLSGAWF